MPLSAGSIEARIGADISGLESGVRAAERVLSQFSTSAQRSIDAAFAGTNVAPAIRKSVGDAVEAARREMDAKLVAARDAFARGLIDEKGLAARAKAAGDDAAKQLTSSIRARAELGILPPEYEQRLVDDLSAAARRAGIDAGNAAADGMAGALETAAPRMEAIGKKLSLALTAPLIGAGAAAVAASVRTGRLADELLALEQATGLSVTALQEYRRVATVAGVSNDQIADAAGRLQRRLRGVGEETKDVRSVLRALGVSSRDARGGLRSMDDLLPDLITSLQGIEDITLRNTLATRLFGRGTEALAPVLGMSAQAFAEARTEAHALGLVLSQDALDAAREFRVQWDTMRQSFGAAARDIGIELMPTISSFVQGVQTQAVPAARELAGALGRLNPETVRLGIAVGGAVAVIGPATTAVGGLTRAMIALRAASLGAGLVLAPGSLIVAGLSLVAGLFIKTKLDAWAAAAAYEEAMRKAAAAGAEFDRANLAGLQAALSNARNSLADLEHDIKLREAKLRDLATTPARTSGASGLTPADTGEGLRLRKEIAALGEQAEVSRKAIEALNERKNELLNPPPGAINRPLDPLVGDLEEILRLQKLLAAGAAGVTLLGGFGIDVADASVALSRATSEAVKLREQYDAAREALAKLGAKAPAGAAEYVADLGRQAADARAEVERLAAAWGAALAKLAKPPAPTTTDSRGGIFTQAVPAPAAIEREHARVTGQLNELYARGLVSKQALEKGGKEAGQQFNAALLRYLSTARLEPEVRAKVQALLKLDLEVEKGAGWQEVASGAATVAQGMVNVADAFGRLDDRSRRALTGVSELARSISGLDFSKSLFSGANLTSVVGIAGGLAQIAASAFGEDPAKAAREQELITALGDLRLAMSGFRVTADAIGKASAVARDVRGAGVFDATTAFFRALERHGVTVAELNAVAKEFGVSLLNDKGQLDLNVLRSADFGKILEEASKSLVGWRDTVDDARRARDLEAKLAGGVDLSDPVRKLESEFEIFARFFELPNVRDLDLGTDEDRDALREVLQTLYQQFAAGTLDLQGLTRDEFLSLFDSMADGLNSFDAAVKSATRGMLNVPPTFDLALRRRMAAVGEALAVPPARPTDTGPGGGFVPPKGLTFSLETLAADFGALSRPVEGAGDQLDRFGDLIAQMGAPMAGFTDSIESAWQQLSRLSARVPAAPATTTSGAGGVTYAPVVHIHNPPAGLDVPRVRREITDALVDDLRAPGTNPVKHAVREAVK